jgi:hypothetical protein
MGFGLGQRTPQREIDPARPAARLGIGGDDLNVGAQQVLPIVDVLRIALADEEGDGRGIGRRMVWEFILPARVNQSGALDGGNVPTQRQRHHIGVEAVNDRTRLLSGPAMGLLDHDIDAGLLLVFRGEKLVKLAVEFARRIVGNVQKMGVRRAGGRTGSKHAGEAQDSRENNFLPFHGRTTFRHIGAVRRLNPRRASYNQKNILNL